MLAVATGLLLAAGALADRAAAPIMHVRNLNPHVGTAVEDGKRGAVALTAARQLRSGATAALQAIASTSSFGMSGVNAHAVLAVPTECRDQRMVRVIIRSASLATSPRQSLKGSANFAALSP